MLSDLLMLGPRAVVSIALEGVKALPFGEAIAHLASETFAVFRAIKDNDEMVAQAISRFD
jgi:hypothetical protein